MNRKIVLIETIFIFILLFTFTSCNKNSPIGMIHFDSGRAIEFYGIESIEPGTQSDNTFRVDYKDANLSKYRYIPLNQIKLFEIVQFQAYTSDFGYRHYKYDYKITTKNKSTIINEHKTLDYIDVKIHDHLTDTIIDQRIQFRKEVNTPNTGEKIDDILNIRKIEFY